MAGKYIVVEGNDGTGKSTQVELLADYLREQGKEVYVLHEPAGTPIADAIRTVIKDGSLERDGYTNLLLFTAARHENWKVAKTALERGAWVLSARNYISTEVYQGYGEGLDVAMIRDVTRTFTDETYMRPDYTFVLHLPAGDEREARIQQRGELETKDTFESRDDAFQSKINDGYQKVAASYGFQLIDADQSIDDIQIEIRAGLPD